MQRTNCGLSLYQVMKIRQFVMFDPVVGLEEVLGLGNAADFRGGGVRRMRDLSLPGGTREPRQGGERVHVWSRRRRNGRQGRVDVGVGGGC